MSDLEANNLSYIGPFEFVNHILPLMENSLTTQDFPRIVILSSTSHRDMLPHDFQFRFDSPIRLAEPAISYSWQWRFFGKFIFGFDMILYAVSQVASAMFAKELQRRLDDRGLPILSIAVHPGEVATEGVMPSNIAPLRTIARLFFSHARPRCSNTLVCGDSGTGLAIP